MKWACKILVRCTLQDFNLMIDADKNMNNLHKREKAASS